MKILFLEDNKLDIDIAVRYIKKEIEEATFDVAHTIKEAKLKLANNTDYSVILVDINLPDGNGLEILFDIYKRKLQIVSIILTSVKDEEQVVTALKAGANDYFVKDSKNYPNLPSVIQHNIQESENRQNRSVKGMNVLYLEHNPNDIDLTVRHFKKYAPNIDLEVCMGEDDAIKKLPQSLEDKCKYQVFLMDYNFPGIDSLDLVKKVRQELKLTIPIIIVTGHGNEEVAIQALKLGVNDYLIKRENYLLQLPIVIENAFQQVLIERHKKIIEESEHKYKLLAENAGDVIFTLNLDLNYTYVSPSVYKLRGYNSEDLIGTSVAHSLYGNSYGWVKSILSEALSSKKFEPIVLELEMLKKDKSRIWTEVKASILMGEDNKPNGILGVTRDITQRKKYEAELIKAKNIAEENNKLKSAFLANVSHEIRTPMNGILGFANLLKKPELKSSKVTQYIEIIENSGKRMLNTINDLMDISKIEAGLVEIYKTRFSLNHLFEYLYNFFKPETEKRNCQLICPVEFGNEGVSIFSDKNKISSVLINLIKNAIKYTNSGGKIEFGYQQKAQEIHFFVKDTGIGISEKDKNMIFDRFVQASQEHNKLFEGAGLGLAISKSYVETLGGKIWLESDLGIGSSFFFTIPIEPNENSMDRNPGNNEENSYEIHMRYFNKNVLIVDDDPIGHELLKELLGNQFKNIYQAYNGSEAVNIFKQKKDIDIVLMDIKMPGMDGFQTTEEIRKLDRDVIIIVQTAFTSVEEKALAVGCNGFLTKPINKNRLFKLFHEIVREDNFV